MSPSIRPRTYLVGQILRSLVTPAMGDLIYTDPACATAVINDRLVLIDSVARTAVALADAVLTQMMVAEDRADHRAGVRR